MPTYADRDRLLIRLGYPTYKSYLEGALWSVIRAKVMKRGLRVCKLCLGTATQVHHLSYSTSVLLGHSLTPLVCLCEKCHERVEYDPLFQKRSLIGALVEYRRLWSKVRGKYALHMARLRGSGRKRKKPKRRNKR